MKFSRDRLTAVLMLLPSLVLLGIFVYGFIGQTLYTSMTNWGQDPVQALALNPVLEFMGLTTISSSLRRRVRHGFGKTW